MGGDTGREVLVGVKGTVGSYYGRKVVSRVGGNYWEEYVGERFGRCG